MPNNNPQQSTPQQQIARAAEGATKAAERLEQGAEQATSAAIEKVRQVREEAQTGLEQQRAQIAKRIRRVGGALLASSGALAEDDALSQQLFETVGDRIERVADYISTVTPGELASDVQTMARRQPGLFFGGSFIIGLALGRFAKSTAGSAARTFEAEAETVEQAPTRRAQGRGKGQSRQASAQQQPRETTQQPRETAQQSSATAQSRSTTPLPQGVGSSSTGTVGVGSAQGSATNASPSYGPGATAATKPQAQPQPQTSATPQPTERGEGTKS